MSPFHYIFDKMYPLIRFTYERIFQQRWYDPITDMIWLGGAPTYRRDYNYLLSHNIKAVVDIRQERSDDLDLYAQNDITHIKLKVPDIHAPPPDAIEAGVEFMRRSIEDGRIVYIHCAKGRSRSSTLVAAYLMKYAGMDFEGARELMVSKRALVKLSERHQRSIQEWLSATDAGAGG